MVRKYGFPCVKPLIPRPQPDNKEGEGAEWDGEGLPPVGCHVISDTASSGDVEFVVTGYHVQPPLGGIGEAYHRVFVDLVYANDRNVKNCRLLKDVKPIQSHRDKVIEVAVRETGVKRKFAGRLYDIGALKLPDGEESPKADQYRQRLIDALEKAIQVNAEYDNDTGEMKPGQEDWIKEAEALIIEIEEASDDQ